MDSIILGFLHGTLSFTKDKVFELCISLRNRGLDMMKILSHILQVGTITSWQIDGETVETGTDFIMGGLQNHCRWWLQP